MVWTIGETARKTGLSVKTVRYYEDIGLVAAIRGENGYRCYDEARLQKLRFVQRARGLGFSLEDCRRLLSLYEDDGRASADVKAIAAAHLRAVDEKLRELGRLRAALGALVEDCAGDEHAECPILDGMAGEDADVPVRTSAIAAA